MSTRQPLGALPARFRRERLLIIGCGDVGQRMARLANRQRGPRLLALTSDVQRVSALRAQGITPLLGNLDNAASIARLSGLSSRVVHLAPPPSDGLADWRLDTRTRSLVQVLARRSAPLTMVYGSTSGVYGDRGGQWVSESDPAAPLTPRAHRRVDAESQIHFFGRRTGCRTTALRIPGIYAPDREGGTPLARLQRGTPALLPEDDVYTNHIHANDLAMACWRAVWLARPQRTINVSDDTEMKMGDYFDLAADLYGVSRPPRISRQAAPDQLPLMLLSFMSESRRLHNDRMKRELRLRLRYPTVAEGLAEPLGHSKS